MIRKAATIAAAAALAFIPLVASAQISPGTDLVGNIDQPIDSGHAQIGQRVTISNVHSQNNDVNGGTIYAHVCDVQKAGQGTPGKIQLCVDKLRTRSGASYALDGRVTNVAAQTKSNIGNEAAGAVGGMILGNIIGKKLGTGLGGLAGAAGGYIYAKNARQNVAISQNAVVTVQVLRARRQASQ